MTVKSKHEGCTKETRFKTEAKNATEWYDSLAAKKQVERLLVLDEIGHNLIEVLEHALEVAKNGTIAQDL